jgi:hypothetical protein
MKLRIRGNTVRVRLTQSEVARLAEGNTSVDNIATAERTILIRDILYFLKIITESF